MPACILSHWSRRRNHKSTHNSINNNTITHNAIDGIFLNSSSNNQLLKNIITQNIYGTHLRYSPDCEIINNSFSDNQIGLLINYSLNTYIHKNYFFNNNLYGMYLDHSTKNQIKNNDITNNKKIGLYLAQNSIDNIIKYNNFINQARQAYFKDTFNNKWSNNYWDDWSKKGIYRIYGKINLLNGYISVNWMNFDFYPSEYKYS